MARKSNAIREAQQQGSTLFRITGDHNFLAGDQFYTTTFTTLNGSGVTGEAIVSYDIETRSITVAISAAGLEPNMVHVQHIHGFPDGTNATTPTLAQDDDGDGFVELAEGQDTYGPILLNLTTNHENGSGGDNGHDHSGDLTGFPTAPDGTIYFLETYQLPAGMLPVPPLLDLREIVLHGLTVAPGIGAGTPGEVDGSGGYELVLPVASGELSQSTTLSGLLAFINETDFDVDAAPFRNPGNSGSSGNQGSNPPRSDNANPRSHDRADNFSFDISKGGALSRDLGDSQDKVTIRHDSSLDQIRLTFTSSEVGNGNADDSGTLANQDGDLAVRVQAEDGSGALTGGISRFDDEGITFRTQGDATFDVRDLVSGAARGDQFDVVILGTSGNDTFDVSGSAEAHYINGGMGADTLTGGVDADFLVGGAGNDTLNGSGGDDSFIGGGGSDTFVFTGDAGDDRIVDFLSGTDKIDLTAYGITSAEVSTMASGADTIVMVDSDANGSADFQITLVGVGAPAAGDYLL